MDFDATKPDGSPRKFMDGSRLKALACQPRIELQDGLNSTYQEVASLAQARAFGR